MVRSKRQLARKGFDLAFRPKTYWPLRKPKASQTKDFSSPYAVYGDKFLPKPLPREVEIARLTLDSTTGDIVSIRARPVRRGILYRVVSEYGDIETTTSRKSSRQPLTLKEMIRLIESMEEEGEPAAPSDMRNRQLDGAWEKEDIERAAQFVGVSSDFYPELAEWYDSDAELWLEKAEIGRANKTHEEVRNTIAEIQASVRERSTE